MSGTIAIETARGAPFARFAGLTDALRRLIRRPPAAIALGFLVLLTIAVIASPLIAPYSPNHIDIDSRLVGPSSKHWFGTDELGRDLLSRIMYGGRLDLGIMATATALTMLLAIPWGAISAFRGAWIDDGLMRVADAFMAMPPVVLALVFAAAFGASKTSLTIIIGVILAPWAARIVRSAVLNELHLEYCLAATAFGSSTRRLLFVEVLPNTIGVLVVEVAIVAANVLLLEATLSFVGLGIQPPASSWGILVSQGYNYIHDNLSYAIIPGVVIFVVILAFSTLADHLQAVLDPRSHGG